MTDDSPNSVEIDARRAAGERWAAELKARNDAAKECGGAKDLLSHLEAFWVSGFRALWTIDQARKGKGWVGDLVNVDDALRRFDADLEFLHRMRAKMARPEDLTGRREVA